MERKLIYGIAVVIIIAGAGAFLYLNGSAGPNLNSYLNQPVAQAQMATLQSIAANSTLANGVGAGLIGSPPSKTNNTVILMLSGKPAVIYIGADYCPYCAITRWGLIIALMRFGNFGSLHYMTSDPSDVFPNTPTFTFYNSSYSSSYITFLSAEIENRTQAPLQQLDPLENSAALAYDPGGGIPFIDFGNMSTQAGIPPGISPGFLKGLNWNQIISQIKDQNSSISQSIIGQANIFTAQICKIDNNTPASVCSQPYAKVR